MNSFWLGLLGAFLGGAGGVLGAELVKFLLDRGRNLEKRRDECLDRMLAMVDEIERSGAAYWNGEYESDTREIAAVEQSLKAGLHSLSRDMADLFKGHRIHSETCGREITYFRSVVTGGDFGDGQQITSNNTILELRIAAGDVKRALRRNRDDLPRRFF